MKCTHFHCNCWGKVAYTDWSYAMAISIITKVILENYNNKKWKIWFLGQKVCSVTHSQLDGQTDRLTTVGILSGFQDVFLQSIIKDRPNNLRLFVFWIVPVSMSTEQHLVSAGSPQTD